MFGRIISLWKSFQFEQSERDIYYYYPYNEEEYEYDPTKVRTSELSEYQDDLEDIETRGSEWENFEERAANLKEESLYHNNYNSGKTGTNPDPFPRPNPD